MLGIGYVGTYWLTLECGVLKARILFCVASAASSGNPRLDVGLGQSVQPESTLSSHAMQSIQSGLLPVFCVYAIKVFTCVCGVLWGPCLYFVMYARVLFHPR